MWASTGQELALRGGQDTCSHLEAYSDVTRLRLVLWCLCDSVRITVFQLEGDQHIPQARPLWETRCELILEASQASSAPPAGTHELHTRLLSSSRTNPTARGAKPEQFLLLLCRFYKYLLRGSLTGNYRTMDTTECNINSWHLLTSLQLLRLQSPQE